MTATRYRELSCVFLAGPYPGLGISGKQCVHVLLGGKPCAHSRLGLEVVARAGAQERGCSECVIMSVSSGSSLCGDGDQGLLLDEEEEIDFYAILNVPRDATDEEITKAYRKKCLIFHPDRHMNDDDKRDAEKVFVKLLRAHEVLTDPKQRAIYDALGLQGLDTQGWELVTRSANPENIRREYEFLQRLRENEIMLTRIHPSTAFVCKTSLAGLFQEDPEDSYGPQLLGVAISQSVECTLTGSDRIGLSGRVKAGNGRGDGSVSAVWKKSAGQTNIDTTASISADSFSLTCRLARNIFQNGAIIIQPSLQYMNLQGIVMPTLTLIYSMRLRLRWQGSIILNFTPVQSAITTTLVHTENNQPKAVFNFTLSPSNPNVRGVYISRSVEHDSFSEISCQIGMFGISPSVQYERRISRFSRAGCALSFSFPSCTLMAKFKVKSGHSSFEWQIVLCDDKEELARSALLGVVVPFVTFHAAKAIFRSTWDRFMSVFEDNTHDRDVDQARLEESQRVINLMRPTAERIKRDEENRHGLVILEARYGQCALSGSAAYPLAGDRTIDVAIPLQSMVNDSQLRIYSVKSQLPGFYDPCPGDAKMLHVRYLFREEAHAVTIPDEMPLLIPVRAHKLSMPNHHGSTSS